MTLNTNFILLERVKCAIDPVYFLNNYGYVFDAKQKKISKMTCFQYQEKCVRDFHKFQNNIVLKSRQCLPGDTFVDTPDGPKPIQDFKIGDLVYSYNLETNQIEMDTVADAWCSGERQCVKLKLKDSRNVEVGENHPFWIVNKQAWVKAKDLNVDDEILDANIGFGDININKDEVKILAYLITDGCTNKQIKFTNNNIDYLEEFETSINNLFPNLEIRKSPKLNGFDYFPHQKHGVNTVNPIMEWCENKGIANKKTELKNLPEEVFYWDKKSVSLLINRIFAGDGWISILKKNGNKRLELGLGSPSLIFLEQIKMLLKKYNIKGNIYEVKNMKLQQNKFYKLRITHSKSISCFIDEIGIYKKINSEHITIINNRKHDVKNTSVVRKIEKTNFKKCYDISVTKNENFLINGLLVHNTGLSVVTAGYVAWKLMFRYDEKILIIANEGAGARRFLATVKQFVENTPAWLQPDSIITNNQTKLEFSNNSWVEAKASSPNAGRGESLTMLILDETAFIKDDQDIWMGAGMALSATKGKCIMISTPNGTGNLYHQTWVGSINKENDFNSLEVHWTENPNSAVGLEWRKSADGEADIPWSPWYEEQCRRLGFDSVKIAQELDLSFEGSKYLAIEGQLIEKYEKRIKKKTPPKYIKYDFLFKGATTAGRFTEEPTSFFVWKEPVAGKKYILGCLPPGEKVLTDSGLKDIENISLIDKLISESGDYVNIINKQIYEVFDENIYEIKVDNTYRTTTFTKEHPLLVSKSNLKRNYLKNNGQYKFNERYWEFDFNYTKAEEVCVGDWIKVPNIYKKNINIDFVDKWEKNIECVRGDFKIDSPLFEKDFWWFIGMWLGDGWIGHYGNYDYSISLCFNKKEVAYLEKTIEIVERLFGRKPTFIEKDDTYNIMFNSKQLYFFILENFGQFSDGKKINEWVKFLPNEFKTQLIKGYFNSDGCWTKVVKNNKSYSKISFVSINLELLESIQDILFSLGLISTLNKLRDAKESYIKNKLVNQKKCYDLVLNNYDSIKLIEILQDYDDIKLSKFELSEFEVINKRPISSCHFDKNEDFIFFKIKNIKKSKFTGNVYNFECETNTFMCHHITTHNCDVSRGDGQDYSTIQVIDVETLEQVAEFRDKIGVDLFPYLIDWVGRIYNNAFVVVEANSFGLSVGFDLRDKFQYRNLFYSKNVGDLHVRPSDYKVAEGVEIPGFQTTRKTRPMLIKSIIEHMREGALIINSARLISEMKTFIMKGDRPEAESGFNDDLIFGFGLALYIRDTEYSNVSLSASMYKTMLDAFSVSSNSSVGYQKDFVKKPNSDIPDVPTGGGGIFIGGSDNNTGEIDDDFGWLLK